MSDVRKNVERNRYEMEIEGETAFVTYRDTPEKLFLMHAEVPSALRGRGAGSRLAGAVLDAIRGEGRKVVPYCGFVADFIHRHPDYRDMLA
jgi:predicted GNAT family acetyltransferase